MIKVSQKDIEAAWEEIQDALARGGLTKLGDAHVSAMITYAIADLKGTGRSDDFIREKISILIDSVVPGPIAPSGPTND